MAHRDDPRGFRGDRGRFNSDQARYAGGPRGGTEGEAEPWRRDRYGSRLDQDQVDYGSGYDRERGGYGRGQGEDMGGYGGRYGGYGGQEYGMEGHGGGPERPDARWDAESPSRSREFDPEYLRWRDAQLRAHDRDYRDWRAHQQAQHDEEYRRFRAERRDSFGRNFLDWRAQQAAAAAPPQATVETKDGEGPQET